MKVVAMQRIFAAARCASAVSAAALIAAMWLAVASTARAAQASANNVVKDADDAFGLVKGAEALGLYSEESVRGFDPLAAGNARLGGLYFDKQGPLTSRLVNDRRIRVGLSALGFPSPAPTGIVDYMLREAGETASIGGALYRGPHAVYAVDLDFQLPDAVGPLGFTGGLAYRDDEWLPGATQRVSGHAAISEWAPADGFNLKGFWGRRAVARSKAMPTIYIAGDALPPAIEPRYFGQPWAQGENYAEHSGALASRQWGAWSVSAGIFRSGRKSARDYDDLYVDTRSDGSARHVIIADAQQSSGSTSGEVRVSNTLVQGAATQVFSAGVRGRDVTAHYGGADQADLGEADIRERISVAAPAFQFGPRTRDEIAQWNAGLRYQAAWRERAQIMLGVQRSDYRRLIEAPAEPAARTGADPWLYDGSVAVSITRALTVFGARTEGLEDSGVAPANARNRGQILGAAQTSQKEVGAQYVLSPGLRFAGSLFEVSRPYFGIDAAQGNYVRLGEQRHRGLELSLAGDLASGLTVVAGALFMSPEVQLHAAGSAPIGRRPVGQPSTAAQLNFDYEVPGWAGASLDCAIVRQGTRRASLDNRVSVPALTTIDIGGRYRFEMGRMQAMLRAQVLNVTDEFSWYVSSSGGLQPLEPRRAHAYLTFAF